MKRRGLAICLLLIFAFNILSGFSVSDTEAVQEEDTTEQTTASDSDDFLVKINYGIDSLISYTGDTPVQITITNQGEDFTGEVTLTVVRDYAKNYGYSNDISIPSGTTKRVFMTIPANSSYSNCMVRILDADGDIVYERTIMNNVSIEDRNVIGVLSDDYAALNYLDGLTVALSEYDTSYAFSLGQMTEETMPDIVSALSTCSMIVIDNYDTSKLSDAQYQALRQWVEKGGILLLGTGAEYNKVLSKFKDDFVSGTIGSLSKKSIQMTGLVETDIESEDVGDMESEPESIESEVQDTESEVEEQLSEIEKAASDALSEEAEEEQDADVQTVEDAAVDVLDMDVLDISVDGGTAVADVADGELFVEKQIGIGKVIVCKAALGMEPFSGYGRNVNAVAGMLNAVMTQDIINVWNGSSVDNYTDIMYSSVIDKSGKTEIPDVGKYIVIFIIYILLVGPGVFIILKWKDKNKALWFAIPAIAVLFTAGVYVISINDTVRNPILTSLTMERYDENSKTVVTGFSVMNPKSAAYKIDLNSKYTNVKPLEDYTYSSMFQNENETTCMIKETVDHTELKLSKSQAFTPMYLQAVATEATEQNIDIHIQAYMDGFEGTITNHLDHDLINVLVCMSNYASYFDRIPAGETVEIKRDSSQQRIYDTYDFATTFLDPNAYRSDVENYNRVNGMGYVLLQDFYSMESGTGFVAGYVEGATTDISSDAKVVEYGQVLAYKAFETTYADVQGKYVDDIHQEYLESSTADWDFKYGICWDDSEIEAVYDFGKDGINTLYYVGIPSYETEMECYIWNPETADWERIFDNNETTFSLQGYYIDEAGTQISLKFKSPNGNTGDCVPTIGGGDN